MGEFDFNPIEEVGVVKVRFLIKIRIDWVDGLNFDAVDALFEVNLFMLVEVSG